MVLPKNNIITTRRRKSCNNSIIRHYHLNVLLLRPKKCWIFFVGVIIISFVVYSFQQSNRILFLSSTDNDNNINNELLRRLRSPSSSRAKSKTESKTKTNNGATTQHSASNILDKYINKITGKFAYSFVISGCDTKTYGGSCTAYVLNAIIASTVLQRHHNSKSDIIFQVRMLSTTPTNSTLSTQLTHWLHSANIKIRYLPRVNNENFATATLEKFRVLELIQYDRVYFLDGDLIPLINMDYHMEMSYRNDCNILQEFVAYQDIEGPINSGSMIVTPQVGKFEQVMNIVHKQRQSDLPYFNEQIGWGHKISNGDEWHSWNGNKGLLWNYWGAHYDQGIQYYYFKYLLGNWTYILENGRIENWSIIPTNQVEEWKNKTKHVFPIETDNKADVDDINNGHQTTRYIAKTNIIPKLTGIYPYIHGRPWHTESLGRDFFHYLGGKKPWISSNSKEKPISTETIPKIINKSNNDDNNNNNIENLHGRDVWLYWLGVANETYSDLNLPTELLPNLKSVSPFPQVRDQRFALFEPTIDIPIPISDENNIKFV